MQQIHFTLQNNYIFDHCFNCLKLIGFEPGI